MIGRRLTVPSERSVELLAMASQLVQAVAAVVVLQCISASWVGAWAGSAQAEGGDEVHWDYSGGSHGPGGWGDLKAEWGVCKSGSRQSPIAITALDLVTDRSLGKLDAKYRKRVHATLYNSGHGAEVSMPAGSGRLRIGGETYRPVQFHIHMPSEHTIMNQSFPLELHLVHKSDDGKLAVIGFLFEEGGESEFLAQFAHEVPSSNSPGVKVDLGHIKMMKPERNYGTYMGSLTTPPCAEGVTWILSLFNFQTASAEQLAKLRASVPKGHNNRPTFGSAGRGFRMRTNA